MRRYFQIYKTLLALNFFSLIEYRGNFFNSAVASISWSIFSIVNIILLTSKTTSVYGWSKEELLLFTGIFNIINGINRTVFSRNLDRFSEIIHRGELDSILIKPADSQFLLSFWLFNYSGIARIFLGIGFSYFVLSSSKLHLNGTNFIPFIFLSVLSLSLLYSLSYIIITITIWFPRLSNLSDFLYNIQGISRYPKEMFQEIQAYVFFLILPLTLTINTPVKVLFGKFQIIDILLIIIFSFGFFLASRLFWKFALRFYTSASG